MERVKVQSSAICAIGYDAADETLEVVFKPNQLGICHVWHYRPVSQSVYDEMLAEGSSVGTIFHRVVRMSTGVASYKVGEEQAETAVPA